MNVKSLKALLTGVNVKTVAIRLGLVAASGAVGAVGTYLTKNPEFCGPATALLALGAHELGVFITAQERKRS